MKKAYLDAVHEVLDESYHLFINDSEDFPLTEEMHEELYQQHISKLQSLGLDDKFYYNPDLVSPTGKVYKELAPILTKIDQAIKKGLSISDLAKNCVETFKRETCAKKLINITGGSISLCMMALASFLILENSILIADTPVGDLFSSDKTKQNDEAFYLTQLGGLFSAVTAFGVAAYVLFRLFLQTPYKKTMREKINACFDKYRPDNLSTDMRNALHNIQQIKLKKTK